MKITLNNFFFLLGVVMVVVMIFTFDVSFAELWQHLCHAGWWMLPILGVWFLIYAINALSWRSIIRANSKDGKKVSFLRIFRLTITGYALNYATPVGGLGGEPYRMAELSKNIDSREATSSVILYAMMHIYAHFWFWFTSVFLYLFLYAIGDLSLTTAIGVSLSLIVLLCLLAFYLFNKGYKNGLVVKTIHFIGKIPGLRGWSQRFLTKHEESLRKIDQQIASLHQQDRRAFYVSFGYEYFSRIVQSLEVMFMLLLFGKDCGGGIDGLTLTFLHSVLIVSFTSLFANLIGFLPMQLGVQEGGFMLSIAAMGLTPEIGFFVSLICRVREIIWIIVGLALMKYPLACARPPRG